MSGKAVALLLCRAIPFLLMLAVSPGRAQDAPVDLLFARPHLSGMAAGSELTYRLERAPSDTKRLGEPFGDDISLVIKAVSPGGARDVDLRIFTGDRAREVSVTDLTGNPLLVIFLDRAVANMVRLAGGTAPYFKYSLRAGLRDKAVSEAATAEFDGKRLAATRITVTPFTDDGQAGRMLGYEGSRFEFLVADAAPGMLLEMTASFTSTLPDAPKLDERIVLKSSSVQP